MHLLKQMDYNRKLAKGYKEKTRMGGTITLLAVLVVAYLIVAVAR